MTDLPNASPAPQAAASPSQGTAAPTSGTIQPTGEAGQSATGSENFIPQGVDVNTLPPAVRAELDRINKEMVRGFTAKTQELAEKNKKYADYDAIKADAEFFRQIRSQEDFVKQWNEFVQKSSGQAGQNGQQGVDPEMRKMVEEIRLKQQQSEMSEIVDAFSKAVDDKGEELHPDFDVLGNLSLGKLPNGENLSFLRLFVDISSGETPQERLVNGYKAAKAFRDQILEEGRKQGMGKMLSKVRSSTQAPTITSDKATFNGDPKKLSVTEARELAEKGVRIR